ncbi:hypothetical protein RIF29_20717 [Crotalaria pallida]|uniref:Transmembrane protein n=1 Tax=Crotalaria pallida TaxID=3830 RepID=A0AAN9F1Q8_CROPI
MDLDARTPMASAKIILMIAMVLVVAIIGSTQAVEAPAPSPTSPAIAISPSVAAGFHTATVALVFGSAFRI